MSDDERFYDGLDDIDRQIRFEKLRREWRDLTGGSGEDDELNLPPSVEEAFLENVLFFENAPRTSYAKMLIEDGIELTAPEDLTDEAALRAKLWEVIRGLGRRQVFLYNTDHLSDRAIYSLLWGDLLNHETVDVSANPQSACHLDILGGGSDEDIRTYLEYYADEEERREWAAELQDGEPPERRTPPYDRDRFLPKRQLP